MASANSPRDEYIAELADSSDGDSLSSETEIRNGSRGIVRRRRWLPVVLFLVTCVSVFWAGSTRWVPTYYFSTLDADGWMQVRQTIVSQWSSGLIYMACLLAILFTHEMGHFLATRYYGIHASWPYFLPLPISPVGTLGAVIGMDGLRANRKEIFDIGLAGPIAGLFVAVPVLWLGIQRLDLSQDGGGIFSLELPLALKILFYFRPPSGYHPESGIWQWQLNPFFMAGWVGLLITGLNMLPVSQLDGGHVIYTLFGRRAHWIARGFMVLAIAYIVVEQMYPWTLMVLLVLLLGTDHPPTRDDSVRIGWFRWVLGLASLAIPLLCFPPHVFQDL